jgi:UDP-GlcNAc3NAcA epimerase
MRIITIVGARPQFVKAAVISRAIQDYNKSRPENHIHEIIIHTGQHFDENMSDVFFEQMSIPKPDYNLEIHSLSHGAMTGQMLEKIEKVLKNEKPDWVLVYGDTNSTLAGALAARKLHIKLAHVEAGLRSYNMDMPEEINRILTDRISDILFCPTQSALNNLAKEGYNDISAKIVRSGDVMYDAALFYHTRASRPESEIPSSDFVLCTIHRQENTDDEKKLRDIFIGLESISKEVPVILPLHPRTTKKMTDFGIKPGPGIYILEPVGYLEMIWLLLNCSTVITDSGGLQKEAYFFKKPCITVREETEWVELVSHGANTLTGADADKILEAFRDQKLRKADFDTPLYGTGRSGYEILKELLKY